MSKTAITLDKSVATGAQHGVELETDSGSSVGIGASVAITLATLVTDTTQTGTDETSSAGDGAAISGAHDIVLSSKPNDKVTTEAEGGADGSVALAPTVSVTIANVTTSASFGKGPAINTDKIDAKAQLSAELEAKASGASPARASGSTSRSCSRSRPTSSTRATPATCTPLGTSPSQAMGSSTTTGEAEAASKGESKDSAGSGVSEGVSDKSDKQLSHEKSRQTTETGSSTDSSSTPKAADNEDSGPSLSLAGAVVINILKTSSTATLANGTSVTGGGTLSLKASANTDAAGKASGDTATDANIGIGASVTINSVDITNQATTGTATVSADGLDVEAGMGVSDTDSVWRFTGGASQLVDSGSAFPSSPSNGDYFRLIEKSGPNNLGVHNWDGSSWASQSVSQGDILPDSAAADTLFRAASHQATAESTSGASKTSDVGIAGSFAMNLMVNHTDVPFVPNGTSVTLGSSGLTLKALSNETDIGKARAKIEGEGSDSVDVGASISLNIVDPSVVRTEIENGPTVTGGHNVDAEATSVRTIVTYVEAGTSGGIAITPAVALVLVNHDSATARIGTSGTSLTATGMVTVHARHTLDASQTEGNGRARC